MSYILKSVDKTTGRRDHLEKTIDFAGKASY
jgi:hypothetical protein